MTLRVDGLPGFPAGPADMGDAAALHRHVRAVTRAA